MKRKELYLAIFFSLATLAVISALGHNQGWFSNDLDPDAFSELGPKRARQYFIEQGARDGSDVAVFGYAWASFSMGDFEAAEKACNHLLQGSLSSELTAGCFYIRGHIYLSQAKYKLAEQSFQASAEKYKNEPAGMQRAQLGLVYMYVLMGDYDNAEKWLEISEPSDGDQLQIHGFWWAMKKLVFLWRDEDIAQALDAANRSIAFYKDGGQRSAMASQLTSASILRMLLGDSAGGIFDANQAKGVLLGLEDEKELAFNSAAWFLYARCSQDKIPEEAQIQSEFIESKAWAKSNNDLILQRWLEWIEALDCP